MTEEKKRGSKAFAIVALVMGIIAIVFSFVPILNVFSYILAVVGIVFGIIGIVKKSVLPMAIIGLVLSAVSIICATMINAGTASVINEAFEEAGISTSTSKNPILGSKKTAGLGDTIKFDGLEITLDTNYTFDTVKNQFSELNGRSVIKLGATVKNVSNENNSLNMFYYDLFGPSGVELDGVTAYFLSDSIDFAGSLQPGASYKTYFYILYDGDGDYSIDFNNYSEKPTVKFNVKK